MVFKVSLGIFIYLYVALQALSFTYVFRSAQGVELVSLINVIRTVKILALKTALDVDVIIEFLQCFPCVEKLNLVMQYDLC
jgi:hypothetical protein